MKRLNRSLILTVNSLTTVINVSISPISASHYETELGLSHDLMFLGLHYEVLLQPLCFFFLLLPTRSSPESLELFPISVLLSLDLFLASVLLLIHLHKRHTHPHALPCHGVMQTVQHPQYIRFHDGTFLSEATNSKARDGIESVVMWWSVKPMLNVMLAEFW